MAQNYGSRTSIVEIMHTRNFLGKTLLVFTAHPDDETFGMAGTIHKNHQKGGKTFVVCATRGEKGMSHLAKPMSEEKLKTMRKKEMEASCRFLKVSGLFPLDFPDGRLIHCKARLFYEGLRIVKRLRPDALLSFGKYGMSGHLDHIAAGEIARRIAEKLQIPLYTLTIPPELAQEFSERIKARRRSPHYTKKPPVFETPTIKISIDPKIKLKAGSFHASQLDDGKPFSSLPARIRRVRLRAEYFALV